MCKQLAWTAQPSTRTYSALCISDSIPLENTAKKNTSGGFFLQRKEAILEVGLVVSVEALVLSGKFLQLAYISVR